VNGPDRVREAIARDRGHYAPAQPVRLCGQPDGTELRADATRPLPPVNRVRRFGERAASAIQCPACLRFRWNPAHWFTCGGWRGQG
jgi:hypothetical protein